MEPEYALRYRELYERLWWWRAREDLIVEALERISAANASEAIPDVGCGDGLLLDRLERFGRVEGVEMDPTGVPPGGRWVERIHVGPFDFRRGSDPLRDLALRARAARSGSIGLTAGGPLEHVGRLRSEPRHERGEQFLQSEKSLERPGRHECAKPDSAG